MVASRHLGIGRSAVRSADQENFIELNMNLKVDRMTGCTEC